MAHVTTENGYRVQWYAIDEIERNMFGETQITSLDIPIAEPAKETTLSRHPIKPPVHNPRDKPSDFRKRGGRDGVRFKIM